MCMENPEIPGRIQMERFIPFAVLPFTRSRYRNDRNFLPLFGLPVPGFMSKESEKFTVIL